MKNARVAACLVAMVACLACAVPAYASRSQETVLQDDPKIVFQDDPVKLNRTLATIKALGIDTIRVSLFWHLVAPYPTSTSKPPFAYGADNPSSYSESRWQRYDRIVQLAALNGLNVLMSITGPAPMWATPERYPDVSNYRPSARAFRSFVKAVGLRYSGFWPAQASQPRSAPPDTQPRPVPLPVPLLATPQQGQQVQAQATSYIPRVTRWSIWNEPNFPNWLLPQWKREPSGHYRQVSPQLYRPLVDAAWAALRDSSHARDLILIGETAPYGPGNRRRPGSKGLMSAPMFIRELYCLNKQFQPYRGSKARVRHCPQTHAQRAAFRSRHPGLFAADGWAHHAYSLTYKPTYRGKHEDAVPIAAVGRLTRALDRSQFRWGAQAGAWTVWVTEYGYQTLPPDPIRGVSWARQAAWMSWAEYLVFRNSRVGSFAQFLLVDDAPRNQFSDTVERWRTWQSGFLTTSGEVKPAFREFRFPIFVTPRRARRGRSARVFGAYRPAQDAIPIEARIEFAAPGGAWQTLDTVTTTNVRGYISRRVRPPGSGRLRIVWTVPGTGRRLDTRAAPITRR
jgi:hypothetical protein